MDTNALDDDVFLALFMDMRLPKAEFKHAQHVQLAWILLTRHPLLDAIQRFRTGLKAFAVYRQVPELYNETITCFYLLLIRERMDRMAGRSVWRTFTEANPDIFGHPKILLEQYYPGGLALTEQAKQAFYPPPVQEAQEYAA